MQKEFESLIGSNEEKDIRRKEDIAHWFEEHDSCEVRVAVKEMAYRQMSVAENSLCEIAQEMLKDKIDDVTKN